MTVKTHKDVYEYQLIKKISFICNNKIKMHINNSFETIDNLNEKLFQYYYYWYQFFAHISTAFKQAKYHLLNSNQFLIFCFKSFYYCTKVSGTYL